MRERFSSRLGFILISAGCAIGLGNVWRFPYIAGRYGGAAFVLIYLFFLLVLGLPVMVMEYAVGRGSQKSAALSFDRLEPKGTHWHRMKYWCLAGNYILMMFYTTVCGWMVYYFYKMVTGQFQGMDSQHITTTFQGMLASPTINVGYMIGVVLVGFFVVSRGLTDGLERISKGMMICLLSLMAVLAFRSVTLPGAGKGLSYYLIPDFSKMTQYGIGEIIFAAMGQAFFTLSLGIGAIAIFGSYIDSAHRLTSEAIQVVALDTLVAIVAGLITIPACFAYHIDLGQGPGLIFVSLPPVFVHMAAGRLWGSLFFLFMSFAAFTTIIAVFQNILTMTQEMFGMSKRKNLMANVFAVLTLSLPCALGFNVWSGIQPLGIGTTIQDLEDFIVSNHLLPLGSLVYVLFCTHKKGWGWHAFVKEANKGKGILFPHTVRFYCSYVIPILILFIFVQGYIQFFTK